MNELDLLNKDWGNLDLQDTRDLIQVLDVLDANDITRAKLLLDDFIARRGYDENANDHLELRKEWGTNV